MFFLYPVPGVADPIRNYYRARLSNGEADPDSIILDPDKADADPYTTARIRIRFIPVPRIPRLLGFPPER